MSHKTAQQDLSGKTSRGAVMTLCGNLLVKGLSVVVMILILAIVAKEDFGYVLLALAVFGIAEVVTNPALQTTLLREPKLQDQTIDVAWTISLIRGVALTTALWLGAPILIAYWGKPPIIGDYLQILSLSFAINGCANLHSIRLRRDLRFGRAFLIENAGAFAGSMSVILALLLTGESFWIVAGPVFGALVGTLVSLICVRPLPRLRLSAVEVQRLWRFSRPLMLSTIMIFILLNGDDVFVESVAGFAALGIYGMSFRWANTGVNLVVQGLQSVLTPVYVKISHDAARLRHAVISSLSVLTAACMLVSGLFLAFAHEFFALFANGSDWSSAAPVAQALVPFVLSRGLNASLSPVFLVLNKPHWLTSMTAVQFVLFLPAMYVGHLWFGLPGIALGVAALSLGVSIAQMIWVRKLLDLQPSDFAAALLPALLTTSLAVATGWLCVSSLADAPLRLFLGSSISVLAFFCIWEFFCRQSIAQRLPQRSFLNLAGMLTR